MFNYKRPQYQMLAKRLLDEPRRFIQVVYGPRQVGKTTLISQFAQSSTIPVHQVAADAVPAADHHWIAQQWETARLKLASSGTAKLILIIDEIQKIDNWSEQVKREWDADTRGILLHLHTIWICSALRGCWQVLKNTVLMC